MKTTKTKLKTKHIYIENGLTLNPAYVLQLARAGYKFCRNVSLKYGESHIFTNRRISSRQAVLKSFKKIDLELLAA